MATEKSKPKIEEKMEEKAVNEEVKKGDKIVKEEIIGEKKDVEGEIMGKEKVEIKKDNEEKKQIENVKEDKNEIGEKKLTEDKNEESKKEIKEDKKKAPIIKKKHEAKACGVGIHAGKKHCMYICNFIKNKKIDAAIAELEQVIKLKRAIPFKGEVPHRKGRMMSGRYPVNASKLFIKLLKGLKGNILINGMDLDKTRIVSGSANWAPRPARGGGRRAKRTHVTLIAKEIGEVK